MCYRNFKVIISYGAANEHAVKSKLTLAYT